MSSCMRPVPALRLDRLTHLEAALTFPMCPHAGHLDAAVQGWDINADNIEICRDAAGEPWLLGEGSYGRVSQKLLPLPRHHMRGKCPAVNAPHTTRSNSAGTQLAVGICHRSLPSIAACGTSRPCCLDGCDEPRPMQVYRGLRGGVQDVAVKVLHASDEAQIRAFRKVCGTCTFSATGLHLSNTPGTVQSSALKVVLTAWRQRCTRVWRRHTSTARASGPCVSCH